jgi:hypothetical protein
MVFFYILCNGNICTAYLESAFVPSPCRTSPSTICRLITRGVSQDFIHRPANGAILLECMSYDSVLVKRATNFLRYAADGTTVGDGLSVI